MSTFPQTSTGLQPYIFLPIQVTSKAMWRWLRFIYTYEDETGALAHGRAGYVGRRVFDEDPWTFACSVLFSLGPVPIYWLRQREFFAPRPDLRCLETSLRYDSEYGLQAPSEGAEAVGGLILD